MIPGTSKEYLDYYKTFGEEVWVVKRNRDSGWKRKCYFIDDPEEKYNHRCILRDEVVFDFDNEDKEINKKNSEEVIKMFDEQGINYSYWDTGNKGFHIHTFWNDLHRVHKPDMIRKTLLKIYACNKDVDYQLIQGHMIRLECSVNEKSGRNKELIKYKDGLIFNNIPGFVKAVYNIKKEKLLTKTLKDVKPSDDFDPRITEILSNKIKITDGRERLLFYFIHKLKGRTNFSDLVTLLFDWYKSSGGKKLTKGIIESKVRYHWNRNYTFSPRYLDFINEN
jgi:hypothetical protein